MTTTTTSSTTLAADISKVLKEGVADVEGAVEKIMALVEPAPKPAAPPSPGTVRAALAATSSAGSAWFSTVPAWVLPVLIGAAVVYAFDRVTYDLLSGLATKL